MNGALCLSSLYKGENCGDIFETKMAVGLIFTSAEELKGSATLSYVVCKNAASQKKSNC